MWESVQEDALFLLWNILSSLIPKQELCFFLLFLSVAWWRRWRGGGGGWRLLGRRAEGGMQPLRCGNVTFSLGVAAVQKPSQTHCKRTFWRGRQGAQACTGDFSPTCRRFVGRIALIRRDSCPCSASQAHVLFLCRREQSPTLKSQPAKIDTSAWMGSLFSRQRGQTPPVADTKKGELLGGGLKTVQSKQPEQRRVCHRAETPSFVGVRPRLNCRFTQEQLKMLQCPPPTPIGSCWFDAAHLWME